MNQNPKHKQKPINKEYCMSRREQLAVALSGSGKRGTVLTDDAKAEIDLMVEDGKKCNEIFKTLKDTYPGVKYQNVRSYLQRQLHKETMKEALPVEE